MEKKKLLLSSFLFQHNVYFPSPNEMKTLNTFLIPAIANVLNNRIVLLDITCSFGQFQDRKILSV